MVEFVVGISLKDVYRRFGFFQLQPYFPAAEPLSRSLSVIQSVHLYLFLIMHSFYNLLRYAFS